MRPIAIAFGLSLMLVTQKPAAAQFADVDSQPHFQRPTITAVSAASKLDETVDFGHLQLSVNDLSRFLQDELNEVGVFVDVRALEIAGVDPRTMIDAEVPPMPLRSFFRKVLQPLGLKAVIENEGVVITADFVELTRRGIATERSLRPEADDAILEKFDQSVSLTVHEVPLIELAGQLSDQIDVPIIVDRRALEEIGLSGDEPLTADLTDMSLRSALRIVLRDLDLTYLVRNEVMEITTLEAAEQNLITRIYFLEGLAESADDATSIMRVIQSTVVPDAWETLGGPSTIQPFVGGRNRPCLVIQATSDVHQSISPLIDGLRSGSVGKETMESR